MKGKQKSWILAGLKHLKAPIVFATLVALLFQVDGLNWDKPSDHVETFAGKMACTRAEWEANRVAVPLDLELGQNNNLLTNDGFCNALYHICNTKPGSGHMTAPVCSSWVFLSRGSTLRSASRPLGRSDSKAVEDGNILAARALVLCLLASAKAMFWCLEQPASSLMYLHPCFQFLIRLLGMHRLRVNMSNYGAPTKKATLLYSSHACLDDIQNYTVEERLEQREMAVRYVNQKGENRVHGGKHLRASQAYPDEFLRLPCQEKVCE
ncbi:unnamed protein product [Cladocopium goreaui]|uniref:Uncharacterized protein n=1 Tax=Cladocopium goreaui TaxID=2562237 RepID=A0A9P1BPS3_9DINO|nr:unnamed protein product [Cladocopium goreaui]